MVKNQKSVVFVMVIVKCKISCFVLVIPLPLFIFEVVVIHMARLGQDKLGKWKK